MYYFCRTFIGPQDENSWSQSWENEKNAHLFGLLQTTNSILGHQLIDKINQNYSLSLLEAYNQAVEAQFGLLLVNKNQLSIIATKGFFVTLKRGENISHLRLNPGQIISGHIFDKDKFYISNSPEFIKLLLSQNTFDDLSPPENTASILIEVHQDQTPVHHTSIPHTPVKQVRARRHFHFFIFSFLFIVFLVGLFYFQYRRQKQKIETNRQQLNSQLADFINKKDTQSAQNSLIEFKKISKDSQLIKEYEEKINKLLNPFEMFYDTKIINESASYSKMIYTPTGLVLLDQNNQRLDQLTFGKGKNDLSKSEKIKSIKDIAAEKEKIYALVSDKILILNGLEFDEFAPLTREIIDFQAWNGNIYALYSDTIEKVSASTPWFQKGESLPKNPISLAVNGKIWVLSAEGQLVPYFRGKEDKFLPSEKLSTSNARNLITSLSSEDLIFNDDNFIYQISKTGEIKLKQAVGNLKIIDMAADFGNKSLYVLASDQKIYLIVLP
jgi:cbb3-type cytochrome oxidase subunit 3